MKTIDKVRAATLAARPALHLPVNDADWVRASACLAANPDQLDWWWPLSPSDPAGEQAKEVCAACPVRTDCLEYARDARITDGIWGGLDEWERQRRSRCPRPAAGETPIRLRPRDPKLRPAEHTPAQRAARDRATKTKLAAARTHLAALGWPRERIEQAITEMNGARP